MISNFEKSQNEGDGTDAGHHRRMSRNQNRAQFSLADGSGATDYETSQSRTTSRTAKAAHPHPASTIGSHGAAEASASTAAAAQQRETARRNNQGSFTIGGGAAQSSSSSGYVSTSRSSYANPVDPHQREAAPYHPQDQGGLTSGYESHPSAGGGGGGGAGGFEYDEAQYDNDDHRDHEYEQHQHQQQQQQQQAPPRHSARADHVVLGDGSGGVPYETSSARDFADPSRASFKVAPPSYAEGRKQASYNLVTGEENNYASGGGNDSGRHARPAAAKAPADAPGTKYNIITGEMEVVRPRNR